MTITNIPSAAEQPKSRFPPHGQLRHHLGSAVKVLQMFSRELQPRADVQDQADVFLSKLAGAARSASIASDYSLAW